ncbi:hypothetical protein JKP88DRAFT_266214, partial [Tribonema minus]
MTEVSEAALLKELRVFVPTMSDADTLRNLKVKLCAALHVDTLDAHNKTIKRLYRQVFEELHAEPDNAEGSEGSGHDDHHSAASDKEETPKKQVKKRARPAAKASAKAGGAKAVKAERGGGGKGGVKGGKGGSKGSKGEEEGGEYDQALVALRAMGRAMGMGPSLYKGLKEESKRVQVTMLFRRLKDGGARFKGDVPTQTEISRAQREREKRQDMDGIDTSLIIESGTRQRRGAARAAAAATTAALSSGSDDDSAAIGGIGLGNSDADSSS